MSTKHELDRQSEAGPEESQRQNIQRVSSITLRDGSTVECQVNEEPGFLQPKEDTQEYPEEGLRRAMRAELKSMRDFEVFEEVAVQGLDPSVLNKAIDRRWAHRWKGIETKVGLVAKGFTNA